MTKDRVEWSGRKWVPSNPSWHRFKNRCYSEMISDNDYYD